MKKKVDHRHRSIKLYEDMGCVVAHVESKNFRVLGPVDDKPGVLEVRFFGTRDLLGFADMIAWGPPAEDGPRLGTAEFCVLVQYTSGSNHAARLHKILANEHARELARRGVSIHLLSWRKPKGKARYEARVQVLDELLREAA